MKKAATIAAIAGVAMASGIEGVEDHAFVAHTYAHSIGGVLPRIPYAVAHDDFADDHFAVEDLADENLFSLFGKKKKPHPQPTQPTKPTNPDDVVDIGDIRVDLNSNEFFSLKDIFHHKKKPQQPQQPQGPVEIPSNEFFAEEMGDDNFMAHGHSGSHAGSHSGQHKKKTDNKPKKPQPVEDINGMDNFLAVEDLGDDNFGLLSIFKKKKKPQHNPDEFKPRELPSNEFFAEELGDENLSFLSGLFHHKKPHHNPDEFKPREIPSNEFFAADDIADDNFSGLTWFKSKKDQKDQKDKKEKKHHHPEKPVEEKPVPAQKPVVNAPSNELFSLKDLFHHKKKPHQPSQPTKPTNPDDVVDIGNIHVDLNSNEFFAEDLGDENFSMFSKLFHKKKPQPHNPDEFKPREIPSNEFFSLKDLFHHKKKPQQPQQPQGPVEIPSNEFFAEELGDENFSMFSKLFHKKKPQPHNPDEFKPREIPSNEFFSLKDLLHHKKKPQQPQQPQGPVEIPSNEFYRHPTFFEPASIAPMRAKVRAEVPRKPDGLGSLPHLSKLIKEAH